MEGSLGAPFPMCHPCSKRCHSKANLARTTTQSNVSHVLKVPTLYHLLRGSASYLMPFPHLFAPALPAQAHAHAPTPTPTPKPTPKPTPSPAFPTNLGPESCSHSSVTQTLLREPCLGFWVLRLSFPFPSLLHPRFSVVHRQSI